MSETRIALLCCCCALSLPPLALLLYEGSSPAAGKHELLRNQPRRQRSASAEEGWLSMHGAVVDGSVIGSRSNSSADDEQGCANACDALPGCKAYSYSSRERRCIRHGSVRSIRLSSSSSNAQEAAAWTASMRRGATWPLVPPTRQLWRHNATIVFAWSGGDVSWMRRLPLGVLDVAVIAMGSGSSSKARPLERSRREASASIASISGGDGRGSRAVATGANASSGAQSQEQATADAAAAARLATTRPRALLSLGKQLSYYTELPVTPRQRSQTPLLRVAAAASATRQRDAPYAAASALAATHFITTFYHNLPPLIIIADERCAERESSDASGACAWISALGGGSAARAQLAITRALEASRHDELPSSYSCLCHLVLPGDLPGEANGGEASGGMMGGGRSTAAGIMGGAHGLGLRAILEPQAARWFRAQFLGVSGSSRGGRGGRIALRAFEEESSLMAPLRPREPPDSCLALAASRVRMRPRETYAALLQLLIVDDKFAGVTAFSWGVAVQSQWLALLYRPSSASAESEVSGGSSGIRAAGGRAGGATLADKRQRSDRTLQTAPPSDPCFVAQLSSQSVCGLDLPSARLRARLRAMRDRMRQSLSSSMTSMSAIGANAKYALPAMPSVPAGLRDAVTDAAHGAAQMVPKATQRARDRVRGWWRGTARAYEQSVRASYQRPRSGER